MPQQGDYAMNQTTTFADWSQLFDELDSLLHSARTSASRLDDVRQWQQGIEEGAIDALTIRGTGKNINKSLELRGAELTDIQQGLLSAEARIERTLRQQLELLKERTASLL